MAISADGRLVDRIEGLDLLGFARKSLPFPIQLIARQHHEAERRIGSRPPVLAMFVDLTWTLSLVDLADESSDAELVHGLSATGRLQVMYQLFSCQNRDRSDLRSDPHLR